MFNNKTKRYVREQGGMYELYREFVDLFIKDGFNLREVKSYSLYLHYGTEDGKIGIEILQRTINEVTIYVGEELPFNRRNEFKIETFTQINSLLIFEKIVKRLRLVKYPNSFKLDNNIDDIIDKANRLYNQGNFIDAFKYYNEAEKTGGENSKIILQKAGCLVKLGHNKEALHLYLKVKKDDPLNFLVYLCLGNYYLDIEDNLAQAMVVLYEGAELGCEACEAALIKLTDN